MRKLAPLPAIGGVHPPTGDLAAALVAVGAGVAVAVGINRRGEGRTTVEARTAVNPRRAVSAQPVLTKWSPFKSVNRSWGRWAGITPFTEDQLLEKMVLEDESGLHRPTSVFHEGYDFWDFEREMRRREREHVVPVYDTVRGKGTCGLGDSKVHRKYQREALKAWLQQKNAAIAQRKARAEEERKKGKITPAERIALSRQERQEKVGEKARKHEQLEREQYDMRQASKQQEQAMKEERQHTEWLKYEMVRSMREAERQRKREKEEEREDKLRRVREDRALQRQCEQHRKEKDQEALEAQHRAAMHEERARRAMQREMYTQAMEKARLEKARQAKQQHDALREREKLLQMDRTRYLNELRTTFTGERSVSRQRREELKEQSIRRKAKRAENITKETRAAIENWKSEQAAWVSTRHDAIMTERQIKDEASAAAAQQDKLS
eukprot:Sspe_Gene.110287::Locus_90749_Transcript_1_1_Confidence_1.000_Length_1430::g.110287::m.110287